MRKAALGHKLEIKPKKLFCQQNERGSPMEFIKMGLYDCLFKFALS